MLFWARFSFVEAIIFIELVILPIFLIDLRRSWTGRPRAR